MFYSIFEFSIRDAFNQGYAQMNFTLVPIWTPSIGFKTRGNKLHRIENYRKTGTKNQKKSLRAPPSCVQACLYFT